MSVGIDSTPYATVVSGFVSTSSWTTFSRCPSSRAISASTGSIMWQGAHQEAVKSTSTGRPAVSTSSAKVASVTVVFPRSESVSSRSSP